MNLNYTLTNQRCGIYIIFNLVNGKRYIGSSKNLYNRINQHYQDLRNGKHHNTHLQASWNKYGEESFTASVLEYCNESDQYLREQYYIDIIQPEYNQNFDIQETYKQQHKWKTHYLYNINTFTLEGQFDNITSLFDSINYHHCSFSEVKDRIIKDKYVVFNEKIENLVELKKAIVSKYYKLKGKSYYIVTLKNNEYKIHRTLLDCCTYIDCGKTTLYRKLNNDSFPTIENPITIKDCVVFYTYDYTPFI